MFDDDFACTNKRVACDVWCESAGDMRDSEEGSTLDGSDDEFGQYDAQFDMEKNNDVKKVFYDLKSDSFYFMSDELNPNEDLQKQAKRWIKSNVSFIENAGELRWKPNEDGVNGQIYCLFFPNQSERQPPSKAELILKSATKPCKSRPKSHDPLDVYEYLINPLEEAAGVCVPQKKA